MRVEIRGRLSVSGDQGSRAKPRAPAASAALWRAFAAPTGVLILLTAFGTFARAQDAFEDVRKTCRDDYHAKCTGNDPSYDIMVACLNQYFLNLSAGCQDALRNAPRSSAGAAGYTGALSRTTPAETPGGPPGSPGGAMLNPSPGAIQNPSPGVTPPEEPLRR